MSDDALRAYNSVRRAVEGAQRARDLFDFGKVDLALSELALAFPILVGMPGVCPFDAQALHEWAGQPMRTIVERDCAAFVLHVADRRAAWRTPLDLLSIMERWAPVERAVFEQWALNPWWA